MRVSEGSMCRLLVKVPEHTWCGLALPSLSEMPSEHAGWKAKQPAVAISHSDNVRDQTEWLLTMRRSAVACTTPVCRGVAQSWFLPDYENYTNAQFDAARCGCKLSVRWIIE